MCCCHPSPSVCGVEGMGNICSKCSQGVRNNDYDELQEAFQRLPLFSNLAFGSADAVAVKGCVKVYDLSDEIITDSCRAENIYILLTGTVNFVSPTSCGNRVVLCQRTAPCLFGDTPFLASNFHVPVVVSSETAKVFSLSGAAFSSLREDSTPPSADVRAVCLSKIPLVKVLPERELGLLGSCLEFESFRPGDSVTTCDGNSSSGPSGLMIVYDGRVQILSMELACIDRANETMVDKSMEITTGGYYGVSSIVETRAVRSTGLWQSLPPTREPTAGTTSRTSAHCLTPSIILSLNRNVFLNFLKLVPQPISDKVSFLAEKRLLHDLSRFDIPLLYRVKPKQMNVLSEMCSIEDFSANTVIFKAGDPGDKFYIIAEGSVEAHIPPGLNGGDGSGEATVSTIHAGSYFGELALIFDQPRHATIIAKQNCVAITFVKSDFDKLFTDTVGRADFTLRVTRHDIPLRHILRHARGVDSFREHLKKEFSSEHLDFLLRVRDYHYTENEFRQLDIMNDIYNRFILNTSDTAINISATLRESVSSQIETIIKKQNADSRKRSSIMEVADIEVELTGTKVKPSAQVKVSTGSHSSRPLVSRHNSLNRRPRARQTMGHTLASEPNLLLDPGSRLRRISSMTLRDTSSESSDNSIHEHSTIFDDAEDEICKMLEGDSFARYKKSELFEQLLVDVQAYAEGSIDINKNNRGGRNFAKQKSHAQPRIRTSSVESRLHQIRTGRLAHAGSSSPTASSKVIKTLSAHSTAGEPSPQKRTLSTLKEGNSPTTKSSF